MKENTGNRKPAVKNRNWALVWGYQRAVGVNATVCVPVQCPCLYPIDAEPPTSRVPLDRTSAWNGDTTVMSQAMGRFAVPSEAGSG